MTAILLWTLCGHAWSAEKPSAAAALLAPKSTEAPAAIAMSDVIPRSAQALNRLHDMRNGLDADNSIGEVDAELSLFTKQLDEWWKAEYPTIRQVPSVRRLNDILWNWRRQQTLLDAFNERLTTSSKQWRAEEQTLDRLLATWQTTQAQLNEATPSAVRDKVVEVLSEGEAIRRMFQEKAVQLVSIQEKLAAKQESLNDLRQEIEATRAQSSQDWLTPDGPPLWAAFSGAEANQSIASQAREIAGRLRGDGVRLNDLYRKRIVWHLALFLALLALLYRLRHLSQRAGDIKQTAAERFILAHGVSSALLLALLCGPLFYSGASPHMSRVSIIPVAIPVFILLPAIFAPRLRTGIYLLALIFLIDFVRYYLPPHSLLARILLLMVALLGVLCAVLMLRAHKSEPLSSFLSADATRSLLYGAIGLCVGSVGANVLGNLNVGEFLVSPVVQIICIGIVIRIAALVARTLVLLSRRAPLALLLVTFRTRGEAVTSRLCVLVNVIAVALWVLLSLQSLGALEYVRSALEGILRLQWKAGAADISVRDFANFFLVFFAAYALSGLLHIILAEEIFPRIHMPRGVPDALERLARYGVLLFGFILALSSAGVNLSQVTLAISALGVGIGFGLQNIVNNFVSGLILIFEHPIQAGDFVEVGSYYGKIQNIGFRASVVRTLEGADVIIPNSELIGSKVINWSLSGGIRRITVHVQVPFGTEPERVIQTLLAAARSQPQVVANPAPYAALEQFGDSSSKFLLQCWTPSDGHGRVHDALTLAIDRAFKESGIQIPFPQSDVHVHLPEQAGKGIPPIGDREAT